MVVIAVRPRRYCRGSGPAGCAIQGTYALTIVLGAYFLAEGVASILYAFEHRRELIGRWSWMLAAGLMDLLIAAIIIIGLPGSALWAVGLLVGINLAFGGATLIGMALAAPSRNVGWAKHTAVGWIRRRRLRFSRTLTGC